MSITTTAAICRQPNEPLSIEDIEIPDPLGTEVLVKVTATGICHTDLSVIEGKLPFGRPCVVGHEGAGVVEAVGSAVRSVRPGDQVLLISPSCGTCPACADGHPALCRVPALRWSGKRFDGSAVATAGPEAIAMRFLGQSTFSSRVLVEERTVLKAPADIAAETIAPFGCGVVTGAGAVLRVLMPQPNDSVVILGGGAVGLSAVMAANLTAASTIIVVDVVPERLELAKELGATAVINGGESENLTESIMQATGGGANIIIETTANVGLLEAGMAALARGGTMGLIGAPAADVAASLPVMPFIMGAKNLRGIVMGDGTPEFLKALMELHRQGKFPVEKLVRTYPFKDIEQAMADAASGAAIKPVIVYED
jgi:aryl-alcohol dehydrogenase